MEFIKLSKRLQAIAAFVTEGSNVADIGTDHGYIPVWLAQHGIANKIAAADINKGPLEHAKETAKEYDVEDRIEFHLCSGLDFETSSEYNTVIIAGMGGELIGSIIEAAPWTRNGTTLILQPNSKIQDLVQWLIENKYSVVNTRLVKDAGKYYQILVVEAGECVAIEEEHNRLIHHLYFQNMDPLLPEYLNNLIKRYKNAEQGMLASKNDAPELKKTQSMINALESMKKEVESWQL